MTSQERVLTAIAHGTPDRVPVDMGSTPSSGISAIAYSNLLQYIGRTDLPILIYDVVQQLAQPDDAIISRFGIDVIDIGRAFNASLSDWYPIRLQNGATGYYPVWFHPQLREDGAWCTYDDDGKRLLSMMPEGATFFDQTYFPYQISYPEDYCDLDAQMNRVMWSRDVHSPWDHASDPDFYAQLRQKTMHLRKTTDKALMLVCGCNLFEWGTFLRRIDNFLMDLICEPAQVDRLLDALLERHLATLEKVCAAVGDIVDIIRFGDDLGMTTGPFMSPEMYRQFFKPRHRQLCEYVHKHSRMHTFIHSCGSIYQLIPDLIDAGIEIFNPVQTNCAEMDYRRLKREFGDSCTFWGGGVENVGVLNSGSPAEVHDQVIERLEVLSEGGGYIFNTIHNIMPDVPPQNIIAMFDAVREFSERNRAKSAG